ncbi:hypothetical protein QUA20_26660 [Microcoleus sp. Pol7_A1]|uniref:hypothetical protein n=1 Tax=Microcoleus sp. Pol7_A1 TaxID=2818893 RepID=UPI002FD1BF63
MSLNVSMDGKAFSVFIEKFLVPIYGKVQSKLIDNLPAHKRATIEQLIKSASTTILNL